MAQRNVLGGELQGPLDVVRREIRLPGVVRVHLAHVAHRAGDGHAFSSRFHVEARGTYLFGDAPLASLGFAPMAFLDPADTGELRLKARHGSLTPAEMMVPLLCWKAP